MKLKISTPFIEIVKKEARENKWSMGSGGRIAVVHEVVTSTTITSTKNKKPPAPKKTVVNQTPKKADPPKTPKKYNEEPKPKPEDLQKGRAKGGKISNDNTKVVAFGAKDLGKTVTDLNTNKHLGIPRHVNKESVPQSQSKKLNKYEKEIKKNLASQKSPKNGTKELKNGIYKEGSYFFTRTKNEYPKLTKLTKKQRAKTTEEMHSGYIVDYSFKIKSSILDSVKNIKKNIKYPVIAVPIM